MEASRGERVLRQSIIVLGCNGVATLLAGLFLVHVGRTLDPHPFADFAVVLALTYLLGLINAPIETGICKLAATYYAARDDARMGRLLTQGLLQGLAILAAEMAVWLPLLWAA